MKNTLMATAAAVMLVTGGAWAQTTTTPGASTASPSTMAAPMTPPPGGVARPAASPPVPATSPAPAAVSSSANPRTTAAPVQGANSFTMREARNRIGKAGYTNVQSLKKDNGGIWRGTAMKDGKSVQVALDYQGNVVSQ